MCLASYLHDLQIDEYIENVIAMKNEENTKD